MTCQINLNKKIVLGTQTYKKTYLKIYKINGTILHKTTTPKRFDIQVTTQETTHANLHPKNANCDLTDEFDLDLDHSSLSSLYLFPVCKEIKTSLSDQFCWIFHLG